MTSNNNKKLVKLDDRVKQVGGTLIIKEAKVEDSGKYLCMVNNSVGGESVETVLTVTGMLTSKLYPSLFFVVVKLFVRWRHLHYDVCLSVGLFLLSFQCF